MKKILVSLVFIAVFLPSKALAQNCGQGQTKKLYILPVVLGMDEAQGGSQLEEYGDQIQIVTLDGVKMGRQARVVNGYDFQLKMANPSDQRCGWESSFQLLKDGNFARYQFRIRDEGRSASTAEFETDTVFQNGGSIRPFHRLTQTITLAPGFPGFHVGFLEIKQDGDHERIVSNGTTRLYQNGEVISQIGMRPVEAKLVNYVQVYSAERDNQRTGIAIANPYFEELKITIELFDRLGVKIGEKEEILPEYGYLGRFINELFPIQNDYFPGNNQVGESFNGTVRITSPKEIPVNAIDGRVSQGKFLMSIVGAN